MDKSIVEFVTLEKSGGDIVYYYSTSRKGVEFCLGLHAPNAQDLRLHLAGEVVFGWNPEEAPNRSELYQALLLFGGELQRRGFIPQIGVIHEFAQKYLGKFSEEGGDD
ncbi:MAG: hypothetical protein ACFNZD_00670 [Candidatus Nanoperiomorbus sp.]